MEDLSFRENYLSFYADNNAFGVPLASRLCIGREDMLNSHSTHVCAAKTRKALSVAEERFRKHLYLPKNFKIYFFKNATDAIHHLLLKAVLYWKRRGESCTIFTLKTEHQATHKILRILDWLGAARTEYVPADDGGEISYDALDRMLKNCEGAKIVSVISFHNELVLEQDLERLRNVTRDNGALLHLDSTQCVGKKRLRLADFCDAFCFSGQKYGSVVLGIAVLNEESWKKPDDCEWSLGTENVQAIYNSSVILGKSLEMWGVAGARIRLKVKNLYYNLKRAFPGVVLHGKERMLFNTLFLTFPGFDSKEVMNQLSKQGWCVSVGASCVHQKDHVLEGVYGSRAPAEGAVRMSFGLNSLENGFFERLFQNLLLCMNVLKIKKT